MIRLPVLAFLAALLAVAPVRAEVLFLGSFGQKSVSVDIPTGGTAEIPVLVRGIIPKHTNLLSVTVELTSTLDEVRVQQVRGGSLFDNASLPSDFPFLPGGWDGTLLQDVAGPVPPTDPVVLDPPAELPRGVAATFIASPFTPALDEPYTLSGELVWLTLGLEGIPSSTSLLSSASSVSVGLTLTETELVGISAIPVPAGFWLLPGALGLLAFLRRRGPRSTTRMGTAS